MQGKRNDGFAEHLAAVEPRIIETIAEFGGKFPDNSQLDPEHNDTAHLYKLIMASYFHDSRSLHEWKETANSYPRDALTAEQIGTGQNPDVQMRAHFLKLGITRLLELIAAPPTMVEDARAILDLHTPAGAEVRAAAQAEWCKDPKTNLRAIARKLGCDYRQLYKDRDRGLLTQPSVDNFPTPRTRNKIKSEE